MTQHVPITLKNSFAVLGCLLVVAMTLYINLPNLQVDGPAPWTEKITEPLGFWQAWGMFRNPSTSSYTVRVTAHMADGSVQYQELVPQRNWYTMSLEQGTTLNLLGDRSGAYIDPMLRYLCSNMVKTGKPVFTSLDYVALPIPIYGLSSTQIDPFTAPTTNWQTFRSINCT